MFKYQIYFMPVSKHLNNKIVDMVTAFYTRISKTDIRNGSVSNSINNQAGLLYEASKKLNIDTDNIQIFIDDGYSGRSSRRPAFRKLIANTILGNINTILVKDFSRFSREHILISEFLEKIFPKYNTRFISVTDRYDSINGNTNMSVPFKNLFNEYYCNDISRKVKTSLSARKEAGKFCTANVPFGYKIIQGADSPEVIINIEEALIVKKIFSLAGTGLNCRMIADILNSENCFAGRKSSGWDASYIWSILNNPFYTGLNVWHKYETPSYRINQPLRLPKNCWKTSKGRHDAIICSELYNKINCSFPKSSPKGKRHIFHGITKCGTCHKALCYDRRKKGYLCCNHCGSGEIKKIQTDMLYNICLEKIQEEFFKQDIPSAQYSLFINSLNCNNSLFYKELLLHNFIKKIEIGSKSNIVIYWNFNIT